MNKENHLKEAISILKHIKDNGSFFISAIEFNSYDLHVDGEEIEKRIDNLLECVETNTNK